MPSIKMTVTAPEKVFDEKAVVQRIISAQKGKTAPEMRSNFKKTVKGWENQPNFSQKQRIRVNEIAIMVFASGEHAEQYAIVNFGSPPHAIRPRQRGGLLRFQPGYRSATSPRMLSSRSPQRFGSYISARAVRHPGFDAREFDIRVAEEIYDNFAQDMQDAIAGK